MSRSCPEKANHVLKCYSCGEEGHRAMDCENAPTKAQF